MPNWERYMKGIIKIKVVGLKVIKLFLWISILNINIIMYILLMLFDNNIIKCNVNYDILL